MFKKMFVSILICLIQGLFPLYAYSSVTCGSCSSSTWSGDSYCINQTPFANGVNCSLAQTNYQAGDGCFTPFNTTTYQWTCSIITYTYGCGGGGGGGGGGGAGGVLVGRYVGNISSSLTVKVTPGNGGVGGVGGTDTTSGNSCNGTNGASGSSGNNGVVDVIQSN